MYKTRAANDRRQKEEQGALDIAVHVSQEPAVQSESTVFPSRAFVDRGAAATLCNILG